MWGDRWQGRSAAKAIPKVSCEERKCLMEQAPSREGAARQGDSWTGGSRVRFRTACWLVLGSKGVLCEITRMPQSPPSPRSGPWSQRSGNRRSHRAHYDTQIHEVSDRFKTYGEKQKRGREPAGEGPSSLTPWSLSDLTTCVSRLHQPSPLSGRLWGPGRRCDTGARGTEVLGPCTPNSLPGEMQDEHICPLAIACYFGCWTALGFVCGSRANLGMTLAWRWHISILWCGHSTPFYK